jgi:hypothetical protein
MKKLSGNRFVERDVPVQSRGRTQQAVASGHGGFYRFASRQFDHQRDDAAVGPRCGRNSSNSAGPATPTNRWGDVDDMTGSCPTPIPRDGQACPTAARAHVWGTVRDVARLRTVSVRNAPECHRVIRFTGAAK